MGLAALLWSRPAAWTEQQPTQEEEPGVIEGRLIDLACYTMGMAGDKHAKCALQCAQKGLPVGLLEEKTEKVYTVLLPSPGLAPYMQRQVRITGQVHHQALLAPDKIELKEADAWKEVELPSAM